MLRCNEWSGNDDYDDFEYSTFKAHFENFLEFLDSPTKGLNLSLLMAFKMRPVWTFSVRYKVTAVFVRGLFSEGVVEVRGSKLQIRCRLILLISEHPIQRGIRKECWHRIPGNGTEFLEIWPPPKKQPFQGVKPKKSCPNFFSGSGIHIKNTFCKKIGSKRPFQPSAVVRTIYRCLYGVATAN